jgi:hypothetical protein
MWPSRRAIQGVISAQLSAHAINHPLPGIANPAAGQVLSWQIVASLRRADYYRLIQQKPIAAVRADPNSEIFDAERAVAYHLQTGNVEEAAWLIFLMTHFARPERSGWLRLQDVYGRLGNGTWDYATVSADPQAFINWLSANWQHIRGKFGNHRKYETLNPTSHRYTGRVVRSYLDWIGPGGQQAKFASIVHAAGNDPHVIFDVFYNDTSAVFTFGRLAKFDYLSLLGRYGLVPIQAGSAYLKGATGPLRGARLLFDGNPDGPSTPDRLQARLNQLDTDLQVGMAVLEDALCNWQKNPTNFHHFLG